MLKNKLFYFVVFAAAAIFAVTFVGCASDDPAANPSYYMDVPADVAGNAAFLEKLLEANGTVNIAKGSDGTTEVVTLSGNLTIPPNTTLNLKGYGLDIGAHTLIIAGDLAGLEAKEEGTQIVGTGTIILKDKSKVTPYAPAAGMTIVQGASNSDSVDTELYFFGDFSGTVAKIKTLTTVFGNVSLTGEASTTAIAVPATLVSISGNLNLAGTGTADGKPHAIYAIGTLEVDGDVRLDASAAIVSTALSVGKNITLTDGAKVSLAATSGKITVSGTATIAASVTLRDGEIANTDSDEVDLSTAIPAVLTGTNAVVTGKLSLGGAGALSVPDGETLAITSGELEVKDTKALTVTGTLTVPTGSSLNVEGTLTIAGTTNVEGTLTVPGAVGIGASAKLDLKAGSTGNVTGIITVSKALDVAGALTIGAGGELSIAASSNVTVAAGGEIDVKAAGAQITFAAATSVLTLSPLISAADAAGGGAKLVLNAAGTEVKAASASTLDNLTANAVGANAFTFAGATADVGSAFNASTAVSNAQSIEAGTTTTGQTKGTVTFKGYGTGASTIKSNTEFKTAS